jgi:hypothetical protein
MITNSESVSSRIKYFLLSFMKFALYIAMKVQATNLNLLEDQKLYQKYMGNALKFCINFF